MYNTMRLANKEDFEDGGLYWPPMQDYPWFAERATELRGRFLNNKTLIVGCGYGYTVQHGLALGMDIWGCDASQYAIDKAKQVLTPQAAARITIGDATSKQSLASVRNFAGLKGNAKFAGAVTEDMLGALTEQEIQRAIVEVRAIATTVLHVISCVTENDGLTRDPSLIWKTQAEWKVIVAPDLVLDFSTGVVI